MNLKNTAVLAVSAVSVFAFAACSDDDSDTSTSSPSPSSSSSSSADPNAVPITVACPEPVGTVKITTGDGQWDPGFVVDSGVVLYPVAFGTVTYKDSVTGQVSTDQPIDKPGTTKTGALECTFNGTFPGNPNDPEDHAGTVEGTVWVRTTPTA